MNAWAALPLEARLGLLALLGAVVGGFVNLATYSLAWTPRHCSPWSSAPQGACRRTWADRVPIAGWIRMRREANVHGRGFWVRPLLVELLMAGAFAALYWWEVHRLAILPISADGPAMHFGANAVWAAHAAVAAQLVLLALMMAASLIDTDERVIPDLITVPGTLLGLLLAACCPWSLLPAEVWRDAGGVLLSDFLRPSSPEPWPAEFAAAPNVNSLAIALGCWCGWCFALLPRRFVLRRGWRKGWQMFLGRLRRDSSTWVIVVLGAIGAAAIGVAWRFAGPAHWAGLLTSLIGAAAGGGLVWVVRLVGTAALRREAMGFGDVTLMAMIGAFVGWQPSLIIFFLAPFAGLLVGALQWIARRDQEIPYGPFLCLATAFAVVRWSDLWQWGAGVFSLGWLIPAIVACCMAAMGVLLGLWRLVRDTLLRAS